VRPRAVRAESAPRAATDYHQVKAADFGRERLRDAYRHRHNRGVRGARGRIDRDEVAGIFDHPIAEDCMPEVGPAGHALRLGWFGAGRARQRTADQQETQSGTIKLGWGHSHSSSL
jgi:hypothetical protein